MKNFFIKSFIFLIFLLQLNLCLAQRIDVTEYGAIGNGKTDDTQSFIKAVNELKRKYSSKNKPSVLYIPAGNYIISQSLELDKYISITGEFTNISVLQLKSDNTPLVVLENNMNESQIYNSYNYIKDITLLGPHHLTFFADHATSTGGSGVGILVKGIRTRIEDVQIEGFNKAGIEVNNTYYTFITKTYLKNNGIGLLVTDTSTSVYLSLSELRFNSIGIMIKNNSFGNFINNNMIESNIASYFPYDHSTSQTNTQSTGRGVVLSNSKATLLTNNYLENHFINFTIDSSSKNNITNNFYAINNIMVTQDKNQIYLQMVGDSRENLISDNVYLTAENHLDPNKIIIENRDFSSNKINVGTGNTKLKVQLQKLITSEKHRPQN